MMKVDDPQAIVPQNSEVRDLGPEGTKSKLQPGGQQRFSAVLNQRRKGVTVPAQPANARASRMTPRGVEARFQPRSSVKSESGNEIRNEIGKEIRASKPAGSPANESTAQPRGESDGNDPLDLGRRAELLAPSILPPPPPGIVIESKPVQGAKPALDPAVIDALVQEIAVASASDGSQEAHIQLNSKTLDGLQIRIMRQEDRISVDFYSQSPQVAELLAGNTNTLAAALASHGLKVSAIRVQNPRGGDTRDAWGGRGNGGQQQRGRR